MTADTLVTSGHHAIILAAGVGRRLGAADGNGRATPKILLDFNGRSLLARHLDLLSAVGVAEVTIVLGYEADAVKAALSHYRSCVRTSTDNGLLVDTIDNPDFREGSVVSLWTARAVLRCTKPILLMDADVLYDRRLLAPLVQSTHADCLLLDRNIEPGDEPVKICVRGGAIVDFRKIPTEPYDWHGESVGFFRLSPSTAAELADRVEDYVASGRRMQEYEEPLRDMIQASEPERFAFEDISTLPWTEIDFPEDVTKARALLPDLVA
jgi:choline kinase